MLEIVAFRGDEYGLSARILADFLDEFRIHEMSPDNFNGKEEIENDFIIVCNPKLLTENFLRQAYEYSRDRGIYFGVISALSIDLLREKLANYQEQISLEPQQYLIILRKENKSIKHRLNAEVFTRCESTVDNFDRVKHKKLCLSMVIDGNRRHLHLSDGKICGINRDIPLEEIYRHFPDCQNCEYERVYAQDVQAECIFMDSCSSTLISTSEKGEYINVGMNFLKNAKVLISSYRPKQGYNSEALLFHHLIYHGFEAGEVLYILNMNSYNHCSDYLPYILYGFPNAKVTSPEKLEVDRLRMGKSEIVLEIDRIAGMRLLEIHAEKDILNEVLKRQFYVLSNDEIRKDVFYSVIPYPLKNSIKLFLYSWEEVNGPLRIVFGVGKRLREDVYSKRYFNMRKLELLGFRHKKIQNQVHDYFSKINEQTEVLDEANRNLKNFDLHRLSKNLSAVEERIYNLLADHLLSQNPKFFIEVYGENMTVRCAEEDLHKTIRCPYCGNYLSIKESENTLVPMKRYSGFCSNCHNVFDTESVHPPKYPEIVLVHEQPDRKIFSVKVWNENVHTTNNLVCFNLWCENRSEMENIYLSRDFQVFTLEPGGEEKFEVEVALKETDQRLNKTYCLYVYWFEDFNLSVSTYTFRLKNV